MDLREFKSAGQLTRDLVPTACLHIATGLAALHELHIIHRDLKPNNLLVRITISGPVFQIADFGVARLSGSAAGGGRIGEMTPGLV